MLDVNEYFDGCVKSVAFQGAEGSVTSGVMLAGKYTFGTSQNELMKVVYGELIVRFADSDAWQSFPAGSEFSVPADSSFDVDAPVNSVYLCFYS